MTQNQDPIQAETEAKETARLQAIKNLGDAHLFNEYTAQIAKVKRGDVNAIIRIKEKFRSLGLEVY